MRIAVTGGTGFVGSHAVVALVRAGHDVRLLARDPARVSTTFSAHDIPLPHDVVIGDATDPAAVARLLEGCDSVLHGASIFSLDLRRAREIIDTNVGCTELVLSAAHEAGLDPIVYISSVASFLPGKGMTVGPDSPVAEGVDPYSKSKGEAERIARRLQAAGAPVVSIMPGAVSGPDDPYFGEIQSAAAEILMGKQPLLPRSGRLEIVDVRDLAQTIAAAFQPGRGPRSYTVSAYGVPVVELARSMATLTGRRIPAIAIPDAAALAVGAIADRIQRVAPWKLSIQGGAIRTLVTFPIVDSTRARAELGFDPRPLEDSLADTVRSMLEAGHIKPKHAGRLATA